MVGAFLAPPIGNSLTAFTGDMPLFSWALLALAALPLLLMIKETGYKPDTFTSPDAGV